MRRLLKLLGRMGKVDEVAHDHFFLRGTVAEMVEIIVDIAAQRAGRAVHCRAIPRPARQRPQGRDPDPRILRSPWRHLAARRSAPHQQASARSVPPSGGRAEQPVQEEKRPRWGVRTSNPGGAASRSLVGSTPTLFRHIQGAHDETASSFLDALKLAAERRRARRRTNSAARSRARTKALEPSALSRTAGSISCARSPTRSHRRKARRSRSPAALGVVRDEARLGERQRSARRGARRILRRSRRRHSHSLAPTEAEARRGRMSARRSPSSKRWYAATHPQPFWVLFETYMPETPRVDF